MMQARIYLTTRLRNSFQSFGLTPLMRGSLRSALKLGPLSVGKRIYPIFSVLSKHPHAGIYEADLEFRTTYGLPILCRVHYFFVDRFLPLFAVNFEKLTHDSGPHLITQTEMELAEELASTMVLVS